MLAMSDFHRVRPKAWLCIALIGIGLVKVVCNAAVLPMVGDRSFPSEYGAPLTKTLLRPNRHLGPNDSTRRVDGVGGPLDEDTDRSLNTDDADDRSLYGFPLDDADADADADADLRDLRGTETDLPYTMNTNTEYKILNYNDLLTSMKALAAAYPDYVSMFTSQERYKLTSAGGYSNHIMIVEDTRRYQTKQSDGHRQKARNSLPEVFLSGALHGNERVGPTAVFETVRLLVLAAACHGTDRRTDACEELRVHDGGAPWAGPWLARLVSTRRIVAVPMANAAGYAKGRREEEDFDPNRDFSYDQNPDLCMRTICGRTINEVWLESLFQLSLTFHGGIELIGWAWGSTNRPIKQGRSPDDEGQKELTHGIVDYGGNFQGSPKYRNGSINDGIIYAVKGGFEEWACKITT